MRWIALIGALLAATSVDADGGLGVARGAFESRIQEAGLAMTFEEGTSLSGPYLHATWPADPTPFLVISLYLEGPWDNLNAVDVECYGQNAGKVAGLFPKACATFMGLLLGVTLPEWEEKIEWLSDAMEGIKAPDGFSIVDRSITVENPRGRRKVTFSNFQTGPLGLRIERVGGDIASSRQSTPGSNVEDDESGQGELPGSCGETMNVTADLRQPNLGLDKKIQPAR